MRWQGEGRSAYTSIQMFIQSYRCLYTTSLWMCQNFKKIQSVSTNTKIWDESWVCGLRASRFSFRMSKNVESGL